MQTRDFFPTDSQKAVKALLERWERELETFLEQAAAEAGTAQ